MAVVVLMVVVMAVVVVMVVVVVVPVVLFASFLPLRTTTHMLQKVYALLVPIINVCPRQNFVITRFKSQARSSAMVASARDGLLVHTVRQAALRSCWNNVTRTRYAVCQCLRQEPWSV